MRKTILAMAFSLSAVVPAGAAVIASSTFTTGDEGWRISEFESVFPNTGAVTHDNVRGRINTPDVFSWNAFIAPAAFLGNQSAAFGGTISFDLGDNQNDGVNYAPLALMSGTTVLFANLTPPPSTTDTLTTFTITLTGANFYVGSAASQGIAATDAQLQAVLGNLQRIAINADWKSGLDFVQLDNVVLSNTLSGGVPEPATWAMMLIGFAGLGYAARRRKAALA